MLALDDLQFAIDSSIEKKMVPFQCIEVKVDPKINTITMKIKL
jgi:hypothetical protein